MGAWEAMRKCGTPEFPGSSLTRVCLSDMKSWDSPVSATSTLSGSVPGSRVHAGALPGCAGSLQLQPSNRIPKKVLLFNRIDVKYLRASL